jgi:WD40 repeat protein
MRSLIILALLLSASHVRADEPSELAPLTRFYNKITNEHWYSFNETELEYWRKNPNIAEQKCVGMISTKKLPGTIRLYRHIRPNGRHVYAKDPPISARLAALDEVNFEAYVWAEAGDGRIGLYCSTWLDGTDVFFEPASKIVEKFSADSKRVLRVDRLRPTLEHFFYIYPPGVKSANNAVASTNPLPITEMAAKEAPAEKMPAKELPTEEIPAEEMPAADLSKKSSDNDMPEKEMSKNEMLSDSADSATKKAETNQTETIAADDGSVQFEIMELENPVTSFCMTEDGKFVLTTHQSSDSFSVYDVLADKVVHTIVCETPRSIISRGDQVFVANYGRGTISVFSQSDGWTLTDQLQVESPKIVHLSAPQGNSFSNELIVTCHDTEVNSPGRASHVYAVNTIKDRCQAIGNAQLATVSFDGKLLVTQDSFSGSPSGGISGFNYQEFTALDTKAEPIYKGGAGQTPYVYQVFPGSYWLSQNMVLGGLPIHQIGQEYRLLIIPDHSQKLFYSIDENSMKVHGLSMTFPELDKRQIRFPEELKEIPKLCQHLFRTRDYLLDHPVAYTHGDRLHLFVLAADSGAMLKAQTEAFELPSRSTNAGLATTGVAPRKDRPERGAEQGSNNSDAVSAVTNVEKLQTDFPKLIPAGKEFRHTFALPRPTEFELMSDLSALTVSPQGELRWRVTEDQIGSQEVKLRISLAGRNSIVRLTTEVVDAQLYESINGDLSKLDHLYRIPLEIDRYVVTSTNTHTNLLLLQGDELSILSSNGQTVQRKLKLPKRYELLKDRLEYLVGVSRENGFTVDLINKKTLQVQRSIPLLKSATHITEVSDLALDPSRPLTFVAVKNSKDIPKNNVLMIDEDSGKLTPLEVFGNWIEISPDGNRLYSGYKDIYIRGSSFHINPGWQLIDIPEYGSIDMLLAWDLRGGGKLKQAISRPGANGFGLRMSPDGRRAVYLSFTGDDKFQGDLIGWNTANFKDNSVRYATKGKGSTTELAFHPTLPWLAVPGGNSAILYHKDSGQELSHKLLLTSSGLNGVKVERLFFAPDGTSLLFLCSDDSGRYLRAVELKLTAEEKATKAPPPAISPETPKQIIVPERALDGLFVKLPDSSLTAKEIGRRYLDAVVSVVTENGTGSGFFIGKSGYLLTSAHVVEDSENIKVIYNGRPGKEFVAKQTSAETIRLDEDCDIALLKISTPRAVPFVALADDAPVETGETVIVIGSPGMGNEILNRTMTSGIVSNPDREINGLSYIQTSAPVNPGNSGGAMFDSRGQVIGLIELKGRIEGAGFAIPSKSIREFLRKATTKNQ